MSTVQTIIAPKEEITESVDKKQNINKNIQSYIEVNPKRELYLKITSYFPNLDKQYKNLLEKQLTEPDNEKNEFTLDIIENIFKYMSEENRLMGMRPYFKTLDDYSDSLDEIAINIASTIKNGNSLMYYMVLLNNGILTKDDIKTWAEAENLGCDEFLALCKLEKTSIVKISNLKRINRGFSVTSLRTMSSNNDMQRYAFKLSFAEGMPLLQKLKTISDVHRAMYGSIYLKESKADNNAEFIEKDIQSEMVDNIIKDRRMESVYNFARYINPEAFKDYSLSSTDVKFLTKDDEKYKNIKDICSKIILNIDFENPKLKEFCEVVNDENIWSGILTTRHSKIRFLSRFVLKDNPTPDLQDDTAKK